MTLPDRPSFAVEPISYVIDPKAEAHTEARKISRQHTALTRSALREAFMPNWPSIDYFVQAEEALSKVFEAEYMKAYASALETHIDGETPIEVAVTPVHPSISPSPGRISLDRMLPPGRETAKVVKLPARIMPPSDTSSQYPAQSADRQPNHPVDNPNIDFAPDTGLRPSQQRYERTALYLLSREGLQAKTSAICEELGIARSDWQNLRYLLANKGILKTQRGLVRLDVDSLAVAKEPFVTPRLVDAMRQAAEREPRQATTIETSSVKPPETQATSDAEAEIDAGIEAPHILVVEAASLLRGRLSRLFKEAGISCEGVASADSAVRRLNEGEPPVTGVLTDTLEGTYPRVLEAAGQIGAAAVLVVRGSLALYHARDKGIPAFKQSNLIGASRHEHSIKAMLEKLAPDAPL